MSLPILRKHQPHITARNEQRKKINEEGEGQPTDCRETKMNYMD